MPPSTQSTTPPPATAVDIRGAVRLHISFRPHPRRVEHMRRTAGTLLRQGGVCEEAIETVQLLVSELVTNAVVHGRGECVRFSLSYDQTDEVLIEVDDHSPARVVVEQPGPEEEHGRGMLLVATLARTWGRRGTCTWCTVGTQAFSTYKAGVR